MNQLNELALTKLQVAEHQLERALTLFLEESDIVSAITLAGASEEILGKLLEKQGKKPALSSMVEATVSIARLLQNRERESKHFIALANHFRDGLKHITDGQPLTVTREAGVEILDRAVENYFALTGWLSPAMQRFLQVAHDQLRHNHAVNPDAAR